MSFFAIIIQPFLLIALGLALSRHKLFPRPMWDGIEKLVYYVLFPPLLFNSVAHASLSVSQTGMFLACGVGSMACGIALSYLMSKIAPADRLTDASVRQCGYRFNSYIGFAMVLALYGDFGLALFALLVGIWVPISNAVAVADLAQAAQKEGSGALGIISSICKNPLIIATVAGLIFNTFGLEMPDLVTSLFKSLGSASLALALMAIGAGLRIEHMRQYRKILALATLQRLALVPAISLAAALMLDLSAVKTGALLCFTALPTANSCYILAVRMGGNGPAVADLTTIQTACSLVTIPLWMALVQALPF
ncbi:MAG TPA: AEC family transporter [Sutterella sp.]|nr:AEC family transporter [Sutterella sp.]